MILGVVCWNIRFCMFHWTGPGAFSPRFSMAIHSHSVVVPVPHRLTTFTTLFMFSVVPWSRREKIRETRSRMPKHTVKKRQRHKREKKRMHTIEKRKLVSCYVDVICYSCYFFVRPLLVVLVLLLPLLQKPLDELYSASALWCARILCHFIQWPFSIVFENNFFSRTALLSLRSHSLLAAAFFQLV